MFWQVVDVGALWVGRIVLGLVALTTLAVLVSCLAVGFQVIRKTWAASRAKTRAALRKKNVE